MEQYTDVLSWKLIDVITIAKRYKLKLIWMITIVKLNVHHLVMSD